jgi:hypothetical protein
VSRSGVAGFSPEYSIFHAPVDGSFRIITLFLASPPPPPALART